MGKSDTAAGYETNRVGIFPRGKTFSVQRGKILQVNQALEKLADNKMIFYGRLAND